MKKSQTTMQNPYDKYLDHCPMFELRMVGDDLSNKVTNKINDTLELMMVNDFVRETNENQFKRSLEDRLADIASWRWVFEDLCRRLEESKNSLEYELKAAIVVGERVKKEIEEHSKLASRPGVLRPRCDCVEVIILEEYKYLKEQEQLFDELCRIIEDQIKNLDKLMAKILNNILQKDQTIAIEGAMAEYNLKNIKSVEVKAELNATPFPLKAWEDSCHRLKREGLNAIHDTLLTKQQVRGARVQLTIVAQSIASKVDSAIRKRLHVNRIKIEDLEWQKEEATKDLQALKTEELNTEQSVISNLEQERVILARLADRSYRPNGEMTRDEVEFNLKAELGRVRRFLVDLRKNLMEIQSLQETLKVTITKIDCYSADLAQIVQLDEDRMMARLNGPLEGRSSTSKGSGPKKSISFAEKLSDASNLQTIQEENEQGKDEQEKDEQEKDEQEKDEQEKDEQEKDEQENDEQEKDEQEKDEQEKYEQEENEQEKYEQEEDEQEKYEQENYEQEEDEQEKDEQVKDEQEKDEQEKYEQDKVEQEKDEQEKVEQEENEQKDDNTFPK